MCDEEASEELLEQLKRMDGIHSDDDKPRSIGGKMKKINWKSAVAHIGLMVSLSVYCAVGGLVSVKLKQTIWLSISE